MAAVRPALLLLASSLYAQSSLQFLDIASGSACCVTTDTAGNYYTAATQSLTIGSRSTIVITKFDGSSNVVYSFAFPSPGGQPVAVVVDSQQNLVIAGSVGWADLETFPLINSLLPIPTGTYLGGYPVTAGFVSKLDSSGSQLLFSTIIAGVTTSYTTIGGVTTDAAGNIYVTGSTDSENYPITSNAYQSSPPPNDSPPYPSYATLTEISADGSKILYSTYIGASGAVCHGVGDCGEGGASANVVAVTSEGSIVVGGTTSAPAFPTTPGAFERNCGSCTSGGIGVFVASFDNSGALAWSTFLDGGPNTGSYCLPPMMCYGNLTALKIASDGSIVLAGETDNADFPVTSSALRNVFPAIQGQEFGAASVFVSRLSATGASLLASTFLGGSGNETISGTSTPSSLALDSAGNVFVAGATNTSNFPTLPNSLVAGDNFVVALDPTLNHLVQSQLLVANSADVGFALDSSGNQILLGSIGSVLKLPATGFSGPGILAQTNAANSNPSGIVAPGELISLFGIGLGPAVGVAGSIDSDGNVAIKVGGTQVTFDGVAAPILYAGPGQVNTILPFDKPISKTQTTVQVTTSAGALPSVTFNIAPTVPELAATAPPYAADSGLPENYPNVIALNQDFTLNSMSNPAAAGSFVVLYAFGCGEYTSVAVDGQLAPASLLYIGLPVTVLFDGMPANVLYAGSAPGIVNGVTQINVSLPSTIGYGSQHSIQIEVGLATGSERTIWAQ